MAEPADKLDELRTAIEQLGARVTRIEAALAVPPSKPSGDSRSGVTVINRIGAVTVAIGIIFFFKYAVDEHLMGAGAGVILGVLFGAVLIAAGDWLNKREQFVFAQGISGCGLASLYISLYASFAFYQLIPEAAAFAALLAVCAVAVALSIRYKSSAIALLGFIGALITPILLRRPESAPWLEFAYILLVNATGIFIAMRHRWPILAGVAGPLSVAAAFFLFEPKHGGIFGGLSLAIGVVYFASSARSNGTVRTALYVVGHGASLIALMRFLNLVLVDENVISELDSVLFAIYGIAALSYGILRQSQPDRVIGLVLLAIVIGKLYVWDIWSLGRFYRITAFLALGALLLVASFVYSRSEKKPGAP